MPATFNMLGVDIPSYAVKAVLSRLRRLKGTVAVEDRGAYRDCPDTHLIFIDTALTVDRLEDWFYRVKGVNVDYDGVFVRENYLKSEGFLFDRLDATPLETGV